MLGNAMLGIIAGLVAASAIPALADDGDGRDSRCALTPSVVSSILGKLTVVSQRRYVLRRLFGCVPYAPSCWVR